MWLLGKSRRRIGARTRPRSYRIPLPCRSLDNVVCLVRVEKSIASGVRVFVVSHISVQSLTLSRYLAPLAGNRRRSNLATGAPSETYWRLVSRLPSHPPDDPQHLADDVDVASQGRVVA